MAGLGLVGFVDDFIKIYRSAASGCAAGPSWRARASWACTLSVIIQVGSFKLTGRRVFRMAPLQHHFELMGWAETTIVVRFWLIAGLFVALRLGIFYLEWLPG